MRNHDFVLVEEHVRHADGLIQQAAAIVAQVDDQAVELGDVELFQRLGQIAIGGFVKRRNAHVADARLHHREILDAGAGNFIAHDGYFNGLVPAFAAERDMNCGALRALQHVGHFGGRQAVAGFAVYFQDDVAGANAGFVRGRADKRREHDRLVLAACTVMPTP